MSDENGHTADVRPPGDYVLKASSLKSPRWGVWLDGECLGTITATQARAAMLGKVNPADLIDEATEALEAA